MKISKTKFVILFLIFGFAFQFISNSLLGSEIALFPPREESFLGTESMVGWKNTATTALLPVRIVMVGPLIPFINLLRQEPDTPPLFFLIGFILYWSLLALVIYYLLGKIRK